MKFINILARMFSLLVFIRQILTYALLFGLKEDDGIPKKFNLCIEHWNFYFSNVIEKSHHAYYHVGTLAHKVLSRKIIC